MTNDRILRVLAAGLAVLAAAGVAPAQPKTGDREPSGYVRLSEPDAAEGREVLERVRRSGLAASAYVEFELRTLPRRGPERLLAGRLWTRTTETGQGTLVDVRGRGGFRLLLENGPVPSLWQLDPEDPAPRQVVGAAMLKPLSGTQFTPFSLQMPFLYWEEAVYEGVVRLRGRPAHAFELRPPLGFPAAEAGFAAVRLWVDTQFGAVNQFALIDAAGEEVQTFAVLELKKLGEDWMVRSIDLRDRRTGDKTRLTVRAAALHQEFEPWRFTPAGFATGLPPVPEAAVVPLDT